MCRLFAATLRGQALSWYRGLADGIITSWETFRGLFMGRFLSSGKPLKPRTYLASIKQREGETLAQYVDRFRGAICEVKDPTNETIMNSFQGGIRNTHLQIAYAHAQPKTWEEMLSIAHRQVGAEEMMEQVNRPPQGHYRPRKEFPASNSRDIQDRRKGKGKMFESSPLPRAHLPPFAPKAPKAATFEVRRRTPLNTTYKEVCEYMMKNEGLVAPTVPKGELRGKNSDEYCTFHKCYGHDIEECQYLFHKVEDAIARDKLGQFIDRNRGRKRGRETYEKHNEEYVIEMITERRGDQQQVSISHVKAKLNALRTIEESYVPPPPKLDDSRTISFKDEELAPKALRKEPIIIRARLQGILVDRIFIDNGSQVNVLYWDAFTKLGLEERALKKFHGVLTGFNDAVTVVKGVIQVTVKMGTAPRAKTRSCEFMVVDIPSDHNVIFGRPLIDDFEMVPSGNHQRVKFPTNGGVAIIHASPKAVWEYMMKKAKGKNQIDAIYPSHDIKKAMLKDGVVPKRIPSGDVPLALRDQTKEPNVRQFFYDKRGLGLGNTEKGSLSPSDPTRKRKFVPAAATATARYELNRAEASSKPGLEPPIEHGHTSEPGTIATSRPGETNAPAAPKVPSRRPQKKTTILKCTCTCPKSPSKEASDGKLHPSRVIGEEGDDPKEVPSHEDVDSLEAEGKDPEEITNQEEEDAENNEASAGKALRTCQIGVTMEDFDLRVHEVRPEAGGETEEVIIDDFNPSKTTRIGKDLSPKDREELTAIIKANADIFAWVPADMPGIDPKIAEHHLDVYPGASPVKQKRRNYSREKEEAIKEEVQKLLKAGFIRELKYPEWLANVVMVKKSTGKWRMCVDFTNLNKACPKDEYPLPNLSKLVDSTAGHKVLSFLDAFSGYHQIKMYPGDQEKTSFIAADSIYCYIVMPFGLKNAGATYQRMVNKVFASQIGRNLEVYVDDMIVKTPESRSHLDDLRETFSTLRQFNMKLNPNKCSFGVSSGKFLGIIVSERGIEANPEKIRALMTMGEPTCLKQVQQLAGRIAALNRFISRAAERSLPFFKALRNASQKFEWTKEASKAFQELKEYLAQLPKLVIPKVGDELQLYLSASDHAVSAVLVKEERKIQRPIYFVSHVLGPSELNYTRIEKLVFALYQASIKLRPYFEAHQISVITDMPLKKVMDGDFGGRLTQWAVKLFQYDIRFQPRTAIKGQALADFVAECNFTEPISDNTHLPGTLRSLSENISKETEAGKSEKTKNKRKRHEEREEIEPETLPENLWILHVDGSSNKNRGGAGIMLVSPEGIKEIWALRLEFRITNNQAEYEALISGLEMAMAMQVKVLEIRCDSQLVVNQIRGEYGVWDHMLQKYWDRVASLVKKFDYCHIRQIPREDNEEADFLAKLASRDYDDIPRDTQIQIQHAPIIETPLQIQAIREGPNTWVDDMLDYLVDKKLPEDPSEATAIIRRSARYLVSEKGNLYRRSTSQRPFLRCLRPDEAAEVLKEIHSGACSHHPGAKSLAEQALRQGYYWPSLRKDADRYVRRCVDCQLHADIPRAPAINQSPVLATWPFTMWGIDLIGKFPASRRKEFVVVAVDYFTKWVELRPLSNITQENVMDFVREDIFARYGLPRAIVSDHGTQFQDRFTAMCEEFGVKHWRSSVCHPQGNGQAEAANKTIIKGLKKTIEGHHTKWYEKLHLVLWSLRTTPKASTGETPFQLVYGSEAILPVELVMPTIVTETFDEEGNIRSRLADLDFVEEKRMQAAVVLAARKQTVKRVHDSKVRPREFKVGDWVLRKFEATGIRPPGGKLAPNWGGPFRVIKIVRPGTYRLEDQEGYELPNPWHADNLKKFYP
ncbi:MAG: reverse transcriptase domain-containing protein [Sweet potato little leaf phytoplasma]|nr:reverse transcriptase domain-containing protein [Sweet potato little leaf phytoplasma]